jgi:hypothetical protein
VVRRAGRVGIGKRNHGRDAIFNDARYDLTQGSPAPKNTLCLWSLNTAAQASQTPAWRYCYVSNNSIISSNLSPLVYLLYNRSSWGRDDL